MKPLLSGLWNSPHVRVPINEVKAAEDSRTPRPRGRSGARFVASASWSAAVLCRFRCWLTHGRIAPVLGPKPRFFGIWVLVTSTVTIALAVTSAFGAGEDAFYKLGPDSLPQEGVPKGKLMGPAVLPSEVFPGTQHTYWVYVPAQYDPKEPAALMIFQDGQAMIATNGDMRVPNVLDNLIWRREIPVIICVFINPGRTPEQPEPNPKDWGDKNTNRPEEYNRLNDKYARVIVDELMPVIKKQYNISPDPDMRAIAGASSGAIAAFTVAWERPNEFRKVISIVGSFTNLRGGHVYPDKILESERKPIRIFLVDGVNDLREPRNPNAAYDPQRDWHFQNVRMVEALTKKGYDVNYTWGIGLHGQKQGGAALPEMMRWLWRDYPRSSDPKNMVERSFRGPAAAQPEPKISTTNGHE